MRETAPVAHVRPFFRRISPDRRFLLSVIGHSLAGVLGGAALAAVTLWVDRSLHLSLPVPITNVRLLLGSLAGAVVTIAVFALWMRTVAVSLSSSQASPRVLGGYLDDSFQQSLTGWMTAGFVHLVLVTAALPAGQAAGAGVPAVSSLVGFVVVLAALSGVLLAIRNAVDSLAMPKVIRSLADHALSLMDRQGWPDDPPPPPRSAGPRTMLRSREMGWVQWIDHEAIIERLPPDATLTVVATIGRFIGCGEVLAAVDAELEEAAAEQIVDGFVLLPRRAEKYDLAYAIQQLVDVAEHAMSPSSTDTSTALEALVHLRAVFNELLGCGTPTGSLRGPQGRWITSPETWRPADHLRIAFQRLVTGGAQDPTTAADLLATMSALILTAKELGDEASEEALSRQRERLKQLAGEIEPREGGRVRAPAKAPTVG